MNKEFSLRDGDYRGQSFGSNVVGSDMTVNLQ